MHVAECECCVSSALTLLVGCHERHLACNKSCFSNRQILFWRPLRIPNLAWSNLRKNQLVKQWPKVVVSVSVTVDLVNCYLWQVFTSLMLSCRYLLCGQDVTGEAYQISTYSRRSSSDSYSGATVVSCSPAQSDFTKTVASKTVQVALSLMLPNHVIFFMSWFCDENGKGAVK